MVKTHKTSDVLPICTLAGIFAGFVAYLLFAPDLLPPIIAACLGAIVGLTVATMEEPALPITEPEEDSLLRVIAREREK